MWKQILIGCGGAIALATAASADSSAITTGDLNLRSGPGTGFSIVSVTPRGESVTVHGCVAGSAWCAINSDGLEGWSNANWLSGAVAMGNIQSYAPGDLAGFTYAGQMSGGMAYATTATYASTGPLFDRPIRGALGVGRWGNDYGTAGWAGYQQGQYVFGGVNGQSLTDTRNGAIYVRQY
jgi:hypothetical protein